MLQVLLLVALEVEVAAEMLRGIAASKRMRRPYFACCFALVCSRDGVMRLLLRATQSMLALS